MFPPCPGPVAAQLVRVCRSGGRIVMANWTPEGHVGQMFKIIDKHVPSPTLMFSPVKWGEDVTVRERFRDGVTRVDTTKRIYPMRYLVSPEEVVEFSGRSLSTWGGYTGLFPVSRRVFVESAVESGDGDFGILTEIPSVSGRGRLVPR